MAHPDLGARLETPTVDYTELRVLCALCRAPEAASQQLASSIGLGPSTVAQVRARLARRGVWRTAYAATMSSETLGPILGFWGRTTSAAPEGGFGPALREVLRGLAVPGLVVSEGAHFAGVALPGGLAKGLAFESEVLGLRQAGSSRPLVDWFRMNAFAKDFTLAARLFDYGDFLERLIPAPLRPRAPPQAGEGDDGRPSGGAVAVRAAAQGPRLQQPPNGPAAEKVAAEVLSNARRSAGASARACSISVSTFAHAKSALLRSGVIERRVRIDVQALGFRFLLFKAIEHRPAGTRGRLPGWLEGARAANAPTFLLGSSLCTVALTPYRTLTEAHKAEDEFRAWAAGQEPLVPPVAFCFDRQALGWFVHDEGGKPSVASLLGVAAAGGERTRSS